MKLVCLLLVSALAVGLVGCQQKSAPAPATAAAPTPSPTVAAVAPQSTSPAEAAAGAPAEAAPAPPVAAPAGEPARATAPLARPAAGASRPGEPLAPAGPATATNEPPPAAPVAAAPAPTPEPIVLAAGTVLPVRLRETITTKTAQPEDRVVAVLDEDVSAGGEVVLPSGSEVLGTVVTSLRSGRVKGRAHLVVSFDQIRTGRRTYDVSMTGFDVTAESSKGKDAKIAGGAAAAGAIIGAIADGGSGAAKGGLIGGAAGGAAVLATRGKEVELAAGSRYQLKLKKALRVQ
jgi:hypothetical protein